MQRQLPFATPMIVRRTTEQSSGPAKIRDERIRRECAEVILLVRHWEMHPDNQGSFRRLNAAQKTGHDGVHDKPYFSPEMPSSQDAGALLSFARRSKGPSFTESAEASIAADRLQLSFFG
jgi:hypothetical protein